ncbi:Transcription factor bHLH130 family [Quillaja saponaria]|uniref:Transcription factor bHLH130 family n=1 Tax=Quillaja saponaria TaxID=32244 RepID=A0AAD7L046_QUISA|nr:Transcription factor bHLH130 family [Quillaja saponaria]
MSILYGPTINYSDFEQRKNPEFMDSNIYHQHHHHQHNTGLSRYCSAPSPLLESFMNNSLGGADEEGVRSEDYHPYVESSSPEVETVLAKFMSPSNSWENSEIVKQETEESVPRQSGFSYDSSQMNYQTQQVQGLQNGCSLNAGNYFGSSFGVVNSIASEDSMQSNMGTRNCSNIIRQNSSPAGFFSNSNAENGFAALRDVGSFRACNVTNGEASTSTSRLNGHINFSSRPSFSSRFLPQIAEIGNERIGASSPEGNGNSRSDLWAGSLFNGLKPTRDNDSNMFSTSNALETQNADIEYYSHGLAHHLSLPRSSTMEKLLRLQSVHCKTRAKRGFATHPRSIAERVRRTRISERIKKLQDLFPKMDKQTSTADMLDLAVEYIKDLQKQVKILTDARAKCECSSKQRKHSSPSV